MFLYIGTLRALLLSIITQACDYLCSYYDRHSKAPFLRGTLKTQLNWRVAYIQYITMEGLAKRYREWDP